jgi:putative transposase
MAGLKDQSSQPRQFWNRIPEPVREQGVQIALAQPELLPRELAWHITDSEGYFISESSVYRILKCYDLVTSPAFILVKAAEKFQHPTKQVYELWQTDFSQFKVLGWSYYYLYLSTVLDNFSRYIVAWKLSKTMKAEDVQETLDLALEKTRLNQVQVLHRHACSVTMARLIFPII